jgi:hypothetical protein
MKTHRSKKHGVEVQLVIKNRKQFVRVWNKGYIGLDIPMKLIDKIREDQWVYDCGHLSNRK